VDEFRFRDGVLTSQLDFINKERTQASDRSLKVGLCPSFASQKSLMYEKEAKINLRFIEKSENNFIKLKAKNLHS